LPIYLAIITRSSGEAEFFVDVTPSLLDPLALAVPLGVWGLRLLPLSSRPHWAKGTLYVCAVLLVFYAVKDLSRLPWASPKIQPLAMVLWVSGLISLYLVPLAMVVGYLRRKGPNGRWSGPARFHCLARVVGLPVAVVGFTAFAAFWGSLADHPADWQVRETLRRHKDPLVRAASRHNLDPRTLAGLIYVIQRDQVSSMGSHLETAMMEAWLSDEGSHMLLSEALDLSIGLAQIKPVTAQTALRLVEGSRTQTAVEPWPKQYRDVPRLGSRWILVRQWGKDCELPTDGHPDKRLLVAKLSDPETSIGFAALILDLYALPVGAVSSFDVDSSAARDPGDPLSIGFREVSSQEGPSQYPIRCSGG
jgi:hypothetical protein